MLSSNKSISRTALKPDFKNSPCTMERESSLKASMKYIEKESFSMWTEWSSCKNESEEVLQRIKYFEAVRNN